MSVDAPAFDALIVGGGIVGCALADRLARAGLRVALVERDCIGGGATAASMGHLVVLDDDPAELALSAYSCARWRAERATLPPGVEYRGTGTLWIATDAEELAEAERKQARLAAHGITSDLFNVSVLRAIEPALAAHCVGGLRVPADAVIYPPVAAVHFARRAQRHGAQLLTGVAVRTLTDDGVLLDNGRALRATAIILATGCALPELLPGTPIRPRKGHLLITTRAAPLIRHQLVELGYIKSAHGDAAESVAFNAQPRATGQLLLGSTRQFDDTTAVLVPRMLQRLLDRAREFLPQLDSLVGLRAWTGFRPTTPDHRPLIGRWPARAGLWLAAGHEGLGVTTALGTADLLAAQLLGEALPFDAAPFDPARYAAEFAHAA
ncbi:FAD-dependent oxidoreductase [Lysobacter sp. CFH 32150]|uniref:NAD(P)/FAD-dependent oxidoreductase n=1 Tax=Lysobacter sp. CFH 32150 TaxID=2927128 RepID=UPI001FA7C066|nr:FAD-binding oxidoreductase [Lysobacter sp. CFH 32150]